MSGKAFCHTNYIFNVILIMCELIMLNLKNLWKKSTLCTPKIRSYLGVADSRESSQQLILFYQDDILNIFNYGKTPFANNLLEVVRFHKLLPLYNTV